MAVHSGAELLPAESASDAGRAPVTRHDVAAGLLHYAWVVVGAWVLYTVWMVWSVLESQQ
jgi:hypothetical protein